MRLVRVALLIKVALCFTAGCASKKVTLTSEPAGARVTITEKNPKSGMTSRVALKDAVTPLTVTLPFNDRQEYTANFEKDQHLPTAEKITFEPRDKTTYAAKLTRFIADSMQYPYLPESRDGVWVLTPRSEKTVAYVLNTVEQVTDYMRDRKLTQITRNDSPLVDFRSIAASPNRNLIAYERIERVARPTKTYLVPKKPAQTAKQIAAANGVTYDELLMANPKLPRTGVVEADTKVQVVEYDTTSRIFRQDPTKPAASRLTNDTGNEFGPAFTPDGDYVVYSTDSASPNATLWRAKLEGGGTRLTRVIRSDSLDHHASVGKDYLVYSSLLAGRTNASGTQVWSAKLDGTEQSRLTDGSHPQIARDDKRILYLAPHSNDAAGVFNRVWVMNADGSDALPLTANEDCNVMDASWSPDGRFIVFAANVNQQEKLQNYDLFFIPADGSAPARQLTSNEAYDAAPVWDHTGKQVYFRSNRGGMWNIWRIDFDAAVDTQ